MNTENKFLVSAVGENIVILRAHGLGRLSCDDALLLAAYLVALSEPYAQYGFLELLEAVKRA